MKKLELSRTLTDAIVDLLEDGLGVGDSCKHEGISTTTFKRWYRIGRSRVHGDKVTDGFDCFADFYLRVSRAKVTGRRYLLDAIRANCHRDWKAAAYLLERMEKSVNADIKGAVPQCAQLSAIELAKQLLKESA